MITSLFTSAVVIIPEPPRSMKPQTFTYLYNPTLNSSNFNNLRMYKPIMLRVE